MEVNDIDLEAAEEKAEAIDNDMEEKSEKECGSDLNSVYEKALESFSKVFTIHLDSKTSNDPFHIRTADIYEVLFNIMHGVGERIVDLGGNLHPQHGKCKSQGMEIISILSDLKSCIEGVYDKQTEGTKNLLAGNLDELEFYIGTSQTFIKGGDMKDDKELEVEITV